ncbi:MAG: hypothetical protein ACREEK_20985 [Bradyrhizobium sp.]
MSQAMTVKCDKNYPTGKSILIYRNRVKPQNQKYFALSEWQSSGIFLAIPSHSEGRIMIVMSVGRVVVDAEVPITNGAEAYGEGVWS